MTHSQAAHLGQSLMGKKAQSRMLTELNSRGQKVLCAPQLITGYEIVENFMEYEVMVIIGGESVYADLLINIH